MTRFVLIRSGYEKISADTIFFDIRGARDQASGWIIKPNLIFRNVRKKLVREIEDHLSL